jgi:5-methylcytosine-specific restriction endonuclease McrA
VATRGCAHCGTAFEAKPKRGIQRMYCGSRCGSLARYVPQPIDVRPCATCGDPFEARPSGRPQKYCGEKCRSRAMYVQWRGPVEVRHCVVCMGIIRSTAKRHFCSRRCKCLADSLSCTRAYKARKHEQLPCGVCGKGFTPIKRNARYCGARCQYRALMLDPRHRSRLRAHGDKRRALKRGASCGVMIIPEQILQRDNWTCQLCGVKTPQSLRGKRVDNAPTIDHIVPLAKGGSHTADNLQCACLRCNRRKGARIIGQIRLALGEVA